MGKPYMDETQRTTMDEAIQVLSAVNVQITPVGVVRRLPVLLGPDDQPSSAPSHPLGPGYSSLS